MHAKILKSEHYFKTLPGLIAILYSLVILCFMLFNAGGIMDSLKVGQQDLEALNWVIYGVLLGVVNSLVILVISFAVMRKKDTILRKEILLRKVLWFLLKIFLLYFVINLAIVLMLTPYALLYVFLSEVVGLLPLVAGILILKRK